MRRSLARTMLACMILGIGAGPVQADRQTRRALTAIGIGGAAGYGVAKATKGPQLPLTLLGAAGGGIYYLAKRNKELKNEAQAVQQRTAWLERQQRRERRRQRSLEQAYRQDAVRERPVVRVRSGRGYRLQDEYEGRTRCQPVRRSCPPPPCLDDEGRILSVTRTVEHHRRVTEDGVLVERKDEYRSSYRRYD